MSDRNCENFWVVSAPGLRTVLFYGGRFGERDQTSLTLRVSDCDGELINQATVTFPAQQRCVLDMEPLLGSLKQQAGFRHGLISVEAPVEGRMIINYQTSSSNTFLPVQGGISRIQQQAIPLHLGEERRNLLVLVNRENSEHSVRAKMLIGKRSPEFSWTLAANSARIFDLMQSFSNLLGEEVTPTSGRGYVRLSTSAAEGMLQHLMVVDERAEGGQLIQFY